MFRRYMIVLTMLACLTGAVAIFYANRNTQQQDEFVVLANECDNVTKGTKEWEDKCSFGGTSKTSIQLDSMGFTEKRFEDFAKYTGYILFFMLISGVLRWIWNGRNSTSDSSQQ